MKSLKSIRRGQIEDIVGGYKWAIDEIRGPLAKKTDFWAKIRPGGRKTARRAAERPLKIDLKVPNRRNPRSYSKKRIFGPKSGPVARKRPQGPGGLEAWGPKVNFFPNIGKWGIQSGATICPDHTALFRSLSNPPARENGQKPFFLGPLFFRHPVALLVIVAFPVLVALPVMYGMVSYDILILSSWVTNYFYP